MRGVILPGQRRVEIRELRQPEPGHGQVLIQMKASSICGSELRAIYREHPGTASTAASPNCARGRGVHADA